LDDFFQTTMIPGTTIRHTDSFAVDPFAAARGKTRVLWELGGAYGLILAAIWTPSPWREALYFVTIGWIALASQSSFSGWRAVGLRWEGFSQSLWVIGVAVGVAGFAVLVASQLGTLHAPHGSFLLVQAFWGYALWSFLQQFLLQDFFLRRLRTVLPNRWLAVAAAAGLFSLAHLPNPVLTVLTLVWGVVSCLIFLRYRNLFTVGIVHAVLGICVAVTVPGRVQHGMRVGLGYRHYRSSDGSRLPVGRVVPS
jgi:hypothetical protein